MKMTPETKSRNGDSAKIEGIEDYLFGHSMKSHTLKEILEAVKSGSRVWILDSGTSGEDDILIGDYDEVLGSLSDHFDVPDFELPHGWSLTEITRELVGVVK